MLLAISGGKLFITYLAVIFVVAFIAGKSFIKKNNAAKKSQEAKMGELNAFILQYEASKKAKAEGRALNEQITEKQTEEKTVKDKMTEDDSVKDRQVDKPDAETVGRIKALYFDAEMPVEKISEKTGVSVSRIEELCEKEKKQ